MNPGAGYTSAPRVLVGGTCKLLPHAVATLENGTVKSIALTGAEGCTGALTVTIDAPNYMVVPADVSSVSPSILFSAPLSASSINTSS